MHSNINNTGNIDYNLLKNKSTLKHSEVLLKTDSKGFQTKSLLSNNRVNDLELNKNINIQYKTAKKFAITNSIRNNNIKVNSVTFNLPSDEDYKEYYNINAQVSSDDYYSPLNIPLIDYKHITLDMTEYTPPPEEKLNYSCGLQVRDYVTKHEEMEKIYNNYIKNIPDLMAL